VAVTVAWQLGRVHQSTTAQVALEFEGR
jgi:hypothetical protein